MCCFEFKKCYVTRIQRKSRSGKSAAHLALVNNFPYHILLKRALNCLFEIAT